MVLPALAFGGTVFKHTDEDGVTHYSDSPITEIQKTEYKRQSSYRNSYSNNYHVIVNRNASKYSMDASLIMAVIETESSFNSRAVSKRGAIGLMQLMPDTARRMGAKRPFEPEENIEAGTKYLKYLIERFNGDLNLALAAYNAGPKAVERYGDIPPYGETRRYVKKVVGTYSKHKEAYGLTRSGSPIYKIRLSDGTLLYSNTKPKKDNRLRF
jgi:soluble lytic murein transglycosylase